MCSEGSDLDSDQIFQFWGVVAVAISIFHLYVKSFIFAKIERYNWLLHHKDFGYLRELSKNEDYGVSNRATKYLKVLQLGYIIVFIGFIVFIVLTRPSA